MDLRASLNLLVLLLGLSKALPFINIDSEFLNDEPEDVDLTTQIMTTNNATGELLVEGDIAIPLTRNALSCFFCKWKKSANGLVEIPVTISPDFSFYERAKIEKAMLTFEKKTCIRFVPRSTEVDYLSLENRGGCFSPIGRSGGKQVVSLNRYGCLYNGLIQHELNHALGFFHEHTRQDRDQYVKIHWEYVYPGQTHNFKKQFGDTLGTPYDYSSVMHYGRTVFSTQRGKPTITPIPNPNVPIGQARELAPSDILRINKLYQCCLHAQPLSVTYSPQHTCSLKGSSVLLTCKYTNLQNYRFSKGYWFKTDSQKHTSVVQEEFSSSQCSLRLNNLTPDSSGVYDYRIQTTSRNLLKGTNGVTVNVWDALHKDCWGVSYSSTSFCVLKGSTVDIPCTYGHPRDHTVNTTLWYKVGKKGVQSQDLRLEEQYQGRVEHLSTEDYNCTLRIRDMREADLGEYRFRYTTNKPGGVYSGGLVTIDVSDLRVSMAADTATEGENVTMTCNTNCIMDGNTTFIWYKNTQLTRHTGIINTLHLNLVSKEDAGNYSCAVAGLEHHPSPEATLSVKYAPWNTAVLAAPPGDTAEGDSVTLTCSSDANPPVHSYTWYMKRGTQNSLLGTGQSYVAANISHEASGLYYCVAQNSVGEHASTAVAVPIAGQGSGGNAAIGILAVVVVPLVLSLLWLRKRKSNRPPKQGSTSTSQQSALPDPNDDTYTSLNNSTRCPDYDTLNITLPDPNEDTYTSLNSSTRCPEYDTLNITLPDPNEDTYTSLNSSTRCPEYDTLNTMRRPTGENDSILVRVTPAPAFRL